ncbi:MAG: hypothetical protein IT298_07045 [Chloroflexi bacterium]|nr:hypothetical protein [Chloroflexota bacterium]
MPDIRIHVLVIIPRLSDAVGIKTALDSVGRFDVRPFTSPINGLNHARTAPPDLAILDVHIRQPNVLEVTTALRKLNPNLKLLLTNAPVEAISKLHADGTIALPARARSLIPQIEELFPPPPPRVETPPAAPVPEPKALNAPPPPDPLERIAREEPPVPTMEEGGTLREAVAALLPSKALDSSAYVLEIPSGAFETDQNAAMEVPPAEPAPPAASTDALAATLMESGPMFDEVRDSPFDDADSDLDAMPTTARSARVEPPATAAPAPTVEPGPPAESESVEELPPALRIPGQRRPARKPAPPVYTGDIPAPLSPVPRVAPEPPTRIPGRRHGKAIRVSSAAMMAPDGSQLKRALTETYKRIGVTAAALILSDPDHIIAHSGEMPTQEIEELNDAIGGDWDVGGQQSRIRYVTLPTSKQEYMLHTRRTSAGHILSLAFAGDLPVRELRKQSDQIANALAQLSSDEPFEMEEPEAEEERLDPFAAPHLQQPITAIWMLEDPSDPITAEVAQAIVLELDTQFRDIGWRVHTLNVHPDFIYIFCEVDAGYLANEIVADLMHYSAEAACQRRADWDPETVWTDAYLALMPGREMGSDEVQSFIQFTRTRLNRKVS